MTIGTAGWAIPRQHADVCAGSGTHLVRYARHLNGVEINSSFYRSHAVQTYARWRDSVADGFRFAVKVPRTITHERALRGAGPSLKQLLGEIAGLGPALGPLLLQLPPSFVYEGPVIGRFLALLRDEFAGAVVCEPRHASWASARADAMLIRWRVGRVAADPPRTGAVEVPGGWLGPRGDGEGATIYYRLHGWPRIYWSAYSTGALAACGRALSRWPTQADVWCIFDNTAAGAALENAVSLRELLSPVMHPMGDAR